MLLVLLAALVRAFVVGQIEWDVVGQFLFTPVISPGHLEHPADDRSARWSLGIFLGVVVAIMRISSNPVLDTIAVIYVWVFRGAPALLQLLLWFNLALDLPDHGDSRPVPCSTRWT